MTTANHRFAIGSKSKNPPEKASTDEKYETWEEEDLIVFSWLIQNIEPVLAGDLIGYSTAKELWDAFVITYSSINKASTSDTGDDRRSWIDGTKQDTKSIKTKKENAITNKPNASNSGPVDGRHTSGFGGMAAAGKEEGDGNFSVVLVTMKTPWKVTKEIMVYINNPIETAFDLVKEMVVYINNHIYVDISLYKGSHFV